MYEVKSKKVKGGKGEVESKKKNVIS